MGVLMEVSARMVRAKQLDVWIFNIILGIVWHGVSSCTETEMHNNSIQTLFVNEN